jgi:hypothetical protein
MFLFFRVEQIKDIQAPITSFWRFPQSKTHNSSAPKNSMPAGSRCCCRQAVGGGRNTLDLRLSGGFKLPDGILNGGRPAGSLGAADTAIRGNFKIRVGIAAVLGDIETFEFFFRSNSESDGFVN